MPQDNQTGPDLARIHVWVEGRVQGVGFRAHVAYNAQKLGVRGWVRNVGYDTVEAVAEGTRAEVGAFLQMIKTGPRGARIETSRVEDEIHRGEFDDFEIRASY